MKKIKYIFLSVTMAVAGVSCSDFLDKGPMTQPSTENFFETRPQVEDYVNNLYTNFPTYTNFGLGMLGEDKNSDNIIAENYDKRLNGELTVNDAQLDWQNDYIRLRDVNYLLHYFKVPESRMTDDVNSLLGEAYFIRAWWHFDALKKFGKIPLMKELWDDHATLNGLQIEGAPRGEVAAFILEDLKRAQDLLLPRSVYKGLRINKEAAMVLAMNVALYEGSWEYYHKNDAFAAPEDRSQEFLEKVIAIGDELMQMGTVSLNKIPGDKKGEAYAQLFNSNDLSDKTEALFWRKYSLAKGVFNNVSGCLASGMVDEKGPAGITQSLVDNYLMSDGTFANTQGEEYKDYLKTFEGRDPRLLQTVMNQGSFFRDTIGGLSKPFYLAEYKVLPKRDDVLDDPAKYQQFRRDSLDNAKISSPRLDNDGNTRSLTGYHIKLGIYKSYKTGNSEQALPLLRYSEALLDYAEAAAILGKATDEVLNKTLKEVQERAGVTYVKPEKLDAQYPSFGYEVTPLIQAIRRDRRSEFALQGMRLDDMMRWAAADLIIAKRGKGAWLGNESLLLKSYSPEVQKSILGRSFLDDNGRLDPLSQRLPNGYGFNKQRDYLLPIPSTEVTLDKKLVQNPGW